MTKSDISSAQCMVVIELNQTIYFSLGQTICLALRPFLLPKNVEWIFQKIRRNSFLSPNQLQMLFRVLYQQQFKFQLNIYYFYILSKYVSYILFTFIERKNKSAKSVCSVVFKQRNKLRIFIFHNLISIEIFGGCLSFELLYTRYQLIVAVSWNAKQCMLSDYPLHKHL